MKLLVFWRLDDEYKKATEDILTAPSFRVLNETLNTRVKKKLREREREKRKDHQERVFSFFFKKARKKGKRLALFFIFFLSSVSFI